ncbi:uncharacterized protein A1O9_11703 [Exophiala aquamarina CBS 119918]|uniref:Uncharacterized protein n=1 Tax=Exophiala aquamarina CBS 119918 TaxID=1182545 RepID=A0A072NXC4_9EURO|nr:uncharacterized protein A1O9_11703 [Exophiala aquamarina CBS 119918]KEF52077.1 hypothetical protein A1O9_11703 [Exophiala aquamarina CBS 119918]
MNTAVGKFQASLAAATQETTFALANLNFDFAIWKVEAPPSYQPLGAALSLQRRNAAENGMPHVIARRLGTLFETLLPQIPSLVNAYGARASEIIQNPGTNPPGSKEHGPFQKFVGLDGTSIWAAATSGPSAVAVHLLACMLARVWSPAEAVSIWEELVAERKNALIPNKDVDTVPTRDVVAAQLAIDQGQLAEWDASARAWLRAADASPSIRKQQKDVISLLSSVSIPVGSHPRVYDSVCKAWVAALSTMDKLVQGHQYSAQDGAVLVALSAWHLYPDVVVLGPKTWNLHQSDQLIGHGGTLTVGLQNSPEISAGVHWSLSLAYLRYYGSSVLSRGVVDAESSRLTFPQFLLTAVGATIASWGLPSSQLRDGAQLVAHMGSLLTGSDHPASQAPTVAWLVPLKAAAKTFLKLQGQELDSATKLVRLGHRRPGMLSRTCSTGVFYLRSIDLICIMRKIEHQLQFLMSIYQNWTHADTPLVLRVGEKNSNEPVLVVLHPVIRQGKITPSWYFVGGIPSAGPDGPLRGLQVPQNNPIHACRAEDLDFGTTGREFTWKNPPKFSDIPSSPVTRVGDSIPPKKERFRWPLKSKKDTAASLPSPQNLALTFEFVGGDINGVSLFSLKGTAGAVRQLGDSGVHILSLLEAFSTHTISARRLSEHLGNLFESDDGNMMRSCLALAQAAEVYECLPGATISPKVFSSLKPISEMVWAGEARTSEHGFTREMHLARPWAFSCIAYFESGVMQVPPDQMHNVMAIASGDSLYVAAQLLCDPAANVKPYEIHRVVGNIGRAGLAFLIPPKSPMVREVDSESWKMVNHEPFNGKLEDNFRSTTLQLGFSGYEFPMTFGDHGGRFVEAFFIEAVVSVHDSGRWVADLDILTSLQSPNLYSLIQQPTCQASSPAGSVPGVEVIALDNWEELLDPPRNVSVVRAHGNWQGRLAAANVSLMQGHPTILFRGHGCWTCAVKVMEGFQSHSRSNISPGPRTIPEAPNMECIFIL